MEWHYILFMVIALTLPLWLGLALAAEGVKLPLPAREQAGKREEHDAAQLRKAA